MSRRKNSYTGLKIILTVMIVAIIAATGFLIKLCLDLAAPGSNSKPASSSVSKPEKTPETEAVPSEEPETVSDVPQVISAASIGVQGDLLMHRPIIKASKKEDGSYDFSPVFRYTSAYTKPLDYAIANLETTFAGSSQPYQGYPAHNCPDALADNAKDAGFDMLLTANNHCNDTLKAGLERTLEQVRQRGMETLGTQLSEDEKNYSVVEINGIKIGMLCYTYAMGVDGKGVCMNGDNTYVQSPAQINWFVESDLNTFYSNVQTAYNAMLEEGAEATVLFIHWGVEYALSENAVQRNIAQKMCDMGFDVIVGGHPHVVQPMDLLTSSTDPEHKTVCIYSIGNAISNQFIDQMQSQKTGHTEDGMLFTMNFEKYSDNHVFLSSVDVLPTWIIRHSTDNGTEYCMVPLDQSRRDQWQSLFDLNDAQVTAASDSYKRTMSLVDSGLQKVNSFLSEAKAARDAG